MSTEQLEKFQDEVEIPEGVTITQKKHMLTFVGPLGKTHQSFRKIPVKLEITENKVLLTTIDQRKRDEKINYLISKFELNQIRDIKAKFLSGGQKKKLVIGMALLGDPELLLLDECFAALDVMTIKMLQQIIVNLQFENKITICICDHQARDLLTCVDVAMVLSDGKIIAKGTPSELVQNQNAKNAYFGDSFKFN